MFLNNFSNKSQSIYRLQNVRPSVAATVLLPAVLMVGLSSGVLRPVGAQITKSGDKYVFRVKFTKGQVIHYLITTTARPIRGGKALPGSKGPIITTRTMTLKAVDVKGKVSTLEVSLGPSITDGKEVGQGQTGQMQVDDHNKALNRAKGSPDGAGLPPDPIKVGGKYSINQSAVRDGKPLSIQATYTFKGIKTVGGRQVAEIDAVTMTKGSAMTKESILTQGTSTVYLSVADGTIVSTTTRQTATTLNAPKTVSMTTDTVMSRQ